MSRLRGLVLVIGVAWACSACVQYQEVVGAVGPAPPVPVPPHGFLRVYTPTDTVEDDGSAYYPHRDFTLMSSDGRVLERVQNADYRWDETPALVSLPVASYTVRSRTLRGRIALVPVVIEPGRTTDVYLDGSFDGFGDRDGTYVALPDGEVVGWSARDSAHR